MPQENINPKIKRVTLNPSANGGEQVCVVVSHLDHGLTLDIETGCYGNFSSHTSINVESPAQLEELATSLLLVANTYKIQS